MRMDGDQPGTSSQATNNFIAEYDKRGTASCKRCKQKISKGAFRLGKLAPNPFSDGGGDMKQWFHPNCIFEAFATSRATTAKITAIDDVSGVEQLNTADREILEKLIEGVKGKVKAAVSPKKLSSPSKMSNYFPTAPSPSKKPTNSPGGGTCPDILFTSFCQLCAKIAAEPSYKAKTAIVEEFIFRRGATGKHAFCGSLYTLARLLLPGEKGLDRVYNMNNKQMIKIFAEIFSCDGDAILSATNEHGDISSILADNYFSTSDVVKPAKSCSLTLSDVDKFLDSMTELTKYEDQLAAMRRIIRSCGVDELRSIIRLLKRDLRMNAKARHILDALGATAYDAFQASRDLKAICSHIQPLNSPEGSPLSKKNHAVQANLMTPIQPMLAEACKSVEYALSKCPTGMFAEIKYDGERVQVHKNGNNFSYFSRSLKPVVKHKVNYLSEAIPKAFPAVNDLILDGEIVLVDTTTHLPLPFGTLGVHKAAAFKKAQVCIFVFDCLHLNGQSLLKKTLIERREALRAAMTEIPDRVVLSEVHRISQAADLQQLLEHVFTEGLEGLVLKPVDTLYEPGKRHWLKMKKDYLDGGAMADTADLIVLGAYFGTGNKGGLMSVFLMGVYDSTRKKFLTVTKCGNGFDDNKLARLQKELDVVRINKDPSKVPDWLVVKSGVTPDFVVRDPKKSPIWEVTGAEFSKAEIHTADGISIRFPRVTKIRDDKDWQSATSLEELKILCQNSRQKAPKLNLPKSSPAEEKPKKVPAAKATKPAPKMSSPASPEKPGVKRKLFDEVTKKKDEEDDTSSTVSYDGESGYASASTKPDAPPKAVASSSSSASLAPSPKKVPKIELKPASSKAAEADDKALDWDPCDIFTGCSFYIDSTSIIDKTNQQLLSRCAVAYGATSVCSLPGDPNITHFVVSNSCKSRPTVVPASAKCIRMSWLSACMKGKSQVDIKPYILS